MIEELKPCPFCGGDAEITKWHEGYFVECKKQRCGGTIGAYKAKQKAIEAWNTRAERTCRFEHIEGTWYKTACGERYDGVVPPNYCPNCGAKVIGG